MKKDTNTPKVSIIMPAYNAEQYIESSINSVLNQTYNNIELIVVDDGSTDSTADIIKSICAKDNRLTLISLDNNGPANARNSALDSLDGSSDFIMFCDSDDLFKPDMVRTAISEAVNGSDLVITGFTIVDSAGVRSDYFEADQRLDADTVGLQLGNLYKANLLNQVWGKVFRSDIIFERNIRFPDFRWGEDRFFVFDYLNSSYSISVLSYCGYEYIMRPGQSLVSGYLPNKADICVLVDERVEELCTKFEVKDDAAFRYMFAKSIFSCIANLYSPSCKLSTSEKRNYVWSIISNERILSRCDGAKGSLSIRALVFVMKTGSISLNLASARFSATVSRLFPDTFRKLKHKK